MLRTLRLYSRSTGIRILYGLLALTFVAWGAGTMGLSRLDVIAEVQGERISRSDLERETALLTQRFRQFAQGAALPPGLDLRQQALDGLIEDALVHHETERLGIDPSDEEVVAAITEMPELQRDGRFDRDLLERILQLERDRGEFEGEVRRRIRTDRLRGLVNDGIAVNDAEVREEYDFQFAGVNLAFVRFAASNLGAEATVTEEDLEAHRTAHAEQYLGPPRVRARYVSFTPDEFSELAAPSPSEIEAYYQERLATEFTSPEQVRARHILVRVDQEATDETRAAARARAEELRRQLLDGADFAELAELHSDDAGSAARGGDLGSFARGRMVPPFEEVAFSLEPGTLSEVVETGFGYHVIEVLEHDAGGPQPLAEVRNDIVRTLSRERGLEAARREADALRRAIVDGKSLAEAAGTRPVHETEPFPEGTFVPGLGAAPAFNDAAFRLGEGEVSDLIEEQNAIYVLAPFGRTERELPPLAEIRARVEADVRREKGAETAKTAAEALLRQAKQSGLAAAAREAGLELETTGPFTLRTGTIPELGAIPELRSAALSLRPSAPLAPRVYQVGNDAVVVALESRTEADPEKFEEERDAVRESLRQRKRAEAYRRYLDLLKQRAQEAGALTVRADVLG